MEGYDVVSNDDQKVGHVVDKQNGYLIVESGLVRKHKYAVPLDAARTDGDEEVVRLTLSKQMVEEGPTVDDGDWQAVERVLRAELGAGGTGRGRHPAGRPVAGGDARIALGPGEGARPAAQGRGRDPPGRVEL